MFSNSTNSKTLVCVTFFNPVTSDKLLPPIFLLWENFVKRIQNLDNTIDFIYLYGGPTSIDVSYPYISLNIKAINIGHYIDSGMKLAIEQGYDSCMIIEGDTFFFKEDLVNFIYEFNSSNIDWASPNCPQNHFPHIPELNLSWTNNTTLPLGKSGPDDTFIILKTKFYNQFIEEYKKIFGKVDVFPMAQDGVLYQEVCRLLQISPIPQIDPNSPLTLDGFVRANAWTIFHHNNFPRGVAVNYDGNSFLSKSLYYDTNDRPSTFRSLVDKNPLPEIEGQKLVCPSFHLGRGTAIMSYLVPADITPGIMGYKNTDWREIGLTTYVDKAISVISLIANMAGNDYHERMTNFIKSKNCHINRDVVDFYSIALIDYTGEI